MQSIVVHYQEIALKGRNRPWFISRLVRNLREATSDLDVPKVRALMGRIEVVLGPGASYDEVARRIARVFGIANFSRAGLAAPGIEEVTAAILRDLGDRSPASFRVSVKRGDKTFPMISPDVEREIGGRIKQARGWRVDLDHPALTIHVEILPGKAFYFFGKEPGAGGLPTGVSGRVACLLSGGIDSPVAAYRLMRRGCPALLVHFHSYPFLSQASQEKVREIAGVLTAYQQHTRLQLVAFGDIQRQVVLSVPPALRVVIYRRLMIRIGEQLARRWSAGALVTGEAIGQVASQTLENLSIIDAVAGLPILRPLVGADKEEITREAVHLGTYPISIIPDQDCCQLFTPRHPATRARLEEVEQAEAGLPVAEWVHSASDAAVTEEYFFPQPRAPRTAGSG